MSYTKGGGGKREGKGGKEEQEERGNRENEKMEIRWNRGTGKTGKRKNDGLDSVVRLVLLLKHIVPLFFPL